MVLSARLRANADMVTPGSRLADVGTDHGYLPIDLVQRGIIASAIAMDLREGPLGQAREHIFKLGLEGKIETRLSDGLDRLLPGEADTVLIAGMGGALTVRILERGRGLLPGLKELVLQPQSEIASVRYFLENTGWRIADENMVFEDGKYYQVLRAVHGSMSLTKAEAQYGPALLQKGSGVLSDYLKWERGILRRNLEKLEKASGERAEERKKEISEKILVNEEAMKRLQECSREMRIT